ncbi:16S rRNA (cytidine(1402)-2'-O)-methyltransferase [Persephonella sp.]
MAVLYVVATPIGNLKDITFRAVEVLKEVNYIACEDTRTTKKLLNHYGITGKTLIPYHEHNEERAAEDIVKILESGYDVALVSDAGTPCISDPGYRVVKLAWDNNIPVVPLPGAFAGVTALSASGLPTDSFLFEGFLPKKKKQKKEKIEFLSSLGITYILYESPKRVLDALEIIRSVAPDSKVVVAKELTKIHEKFFRGSPQEVISILSSDSQLLKGEFVIIVYPEQAEEIDIEEIKKEIKKLLEEGKKTGETARIISDRFSISKKEAYKLVLELQNE